VSAPLPPGVAAGHPATAAAGVEILTEGGSAVDAAVAGCLASCVAETVMTGLLGGGHAIVYDAAKGRVRNLDCFCAVPGLGAEPREAKLLELELPFGAELIHYAIGPPSCGVPGIPAGLGALWREYGVLPWARLVEPALQLARDGVELPPTHAAVLEMIAPALTRDSGTRIYSPGGVLLRGGDRLEQPGLVNALESLATEGPEGAYSGTIARGLLELAGERGALLTVADLDGYQPQWTEPVKVTRLGLRWLTRSGISLVPETLAVLPDLGALAPSERVVALVSALGDAPRVEQHTTNIVAVDAAGNACVLTTSLGVGSGDYLPRLDLHLNSMLGEADLVVGGLAPAGGRIPSMMAPTLVLDDEGLALAVGAAGGTRIRTALLTSAAGVLDEGLAPQEAIDRPRVHSEGAVVNAEPGADEEGLSALEAAGKTVRRWPGKHHYFGGVSLVARAGGAADPRRDGTALSAR